MDYRVLGPLDVRADDVPLSLGGRKQTADVVSGGSYYSQNAFTLYFGTGKADKVDRIEVRWPNGETQSWTNLPVNRTVLITEGREAIEQKPFLSNPSR